MTGRNRGKQQVFWIMAIGVPLVGRLGGTGNVGFACNTGRMMPLIGSVVFGALPEIAGPGDGGGVVMFFHSLTKVRKSLILTTGTLQLIDLREENYDT